jgi:hypothetical protein
VKRKNNNIILLDKLIDDTKKGVIDWSYLNLKNNNNKWDLYSYKGKKTITDNKYINFILTHDIYQGNDGQISVFLCNTKLKNKDLIFRVNPGFFSFKQKKLLDELTLLISNSINSKKSNASFTTKKEVENTDKKIEDVEPLKKVWDDEDLDDDIKGIPV